MQRFKKLLLAKIGNQCERIYWPVKTIIEIFDTSINNSEVNYTTMLMLLRDHLLF